MSAHELQRATVYYAGQVQGVGFRYTASSIARRFVVTGFVRNLADGRVELVIEGERRELDAFQAAVRERLASHIRDELTDISPATGEFHRFQISH